MDCQLMLDVSLITKRNIRMTLNLVDLPYIQKRGPTSNPNFSESSSLYDAASTTLLTFWAAFTNCFYENGS